MSTCQKEKMNEKGLKSPKSIAEDWNKEHAEIFPDDNLVDHPSHYQSYSSNNLECIDAMCAAFGEGAVIAFCKLNAFKYIWRASSKGGNQDISKAIWYLDKYLELNKE